MKTPFCLLIACVLSGSFLTSQVVLNEVCMSNYDHFPLMGTAFYQGAHYYDWIELYNNSGSDVDLSGWHLSDKLNNPTKFQIPSGTIIAAEGYLLILCSGYGHDNPEGDSAPNAHNRVNANFRLKQSPVGEWVILADPGGNIVDSLEPNQKTRQNHSRGRFPDGTGEWHIFTTPTPELPNVDNVFEGYTSTPEFDQLAGYHPGPITLTITNDQPGSIIRYTTNGGEPVPSSPIYTEPITLESTTVIRARTFDPNNELTPGFTQTATYFFGPDQHTLPVVSVSGNFMNQLLGGNASIKALCHFEIFDETGQRISLTAGESSKYGNDSWAYQQRGFEYKVLDKMGLGNRIEAELFTDSDRDKFPRLTLRNAGNDNYPFGQGAHVRDAFVQTISHHADLSLQERRYEPCVLYKNGEYWGVYEMRERNDHHGYLKYYHNQPRNFSYLVKTWGGTWTKYGAPNAQPDWNNTKNFILDNDMSDPGNFEAAAQLLDMQSLTDYFILNHFFRNTEWLNWSTMWWRGRSSEGEYQHWGYLLWDKDYTMGAGPAEPLLPSNCDYIEGLTNIGGNFHLPMFAKLLENEDFHNAYLNRYADLLNTYFSCEYLHNHLDSLAGLLSPEMPRQIQRWGGNLNAWNTRVEDVHNWISGRCEGVIFEDLEECFEEEANGMTLYSEGNGGILLNSVYVSPDMPTWTGTYFNNIPISLQAIDGTDEFAYWEVVAGDLVLEDPNSPSTTLWMQSSGILKAVFGVPDRVSEPNAAKDFVNAYPNPFNETVRWASAAHNPVATVEVWDASGRIIRSWRPTGRLIGTQSLQSGIYMFVFTLADGKRFPVKMVKH